MPAERQLSLFIRDSFRSVWTLELLLHLKQHGDRAWSRAELVQRLRASDSIIANGAESLFASGLILIEDDGLARYRPASAELEALVEAAEALYARRPDAVRRLIVDPAAQAAAAFADAFRLRKD